MQEKVAGRDPKQIAAAGGVRKFEDGGPRPDVTKKMQDKGLSGMLTLIMVEEHLCVE